MANRRRGSEDVRRPFKKRRHAPGTNAGQSRVGYSDASIAMSQTKSLIEAAAVAVNKFGVPRWLVTRVLRDDKRNNVKLMRLVTLCKRYMGRARFRRDLSVAKAKGAKHGLQEWSRYLEGGPRRPPPRVGECPPEEGA